MSIINDALKKTAEDLQKNTPPAQNQEPVRPGRRIVLLYILILVAGLFLGNFIFNLLKNKIQPAPPKPKKTALLAVPEAAKPSLPAAQPGITAPKEQKTSTDNFILSGIFLSDEENYALVNNKIVRKNDLVNGAKVEKITLGTVELDTGEEKITLTTNR
jgi:hypothetical protein